MTFDWNDEKAATNLAKHGVSFDEARRSLPTLWPASLPILTTPSANGVKSSPGAPRPVGCCWYPLQGDEGRSASSVPGN